MTVLVCDAETNGFLPDVNTLWCLGIKDHHSGESQAYSDFDSSLPSVSEGIARINAAKRTIWHNGLLYDIPVLQHLGYDVSHHNVVDTLVLSRLYEPDREGGHSLAEWGKTFKCYKGDWTDFSKFDPGMVEYMLQDLEVGERTYTHLKRMMPSSIWKESVELEHKVTWIIGKQIRNGFQLNVEKAQKLSSELMAQKKQMEWDLQDTFPPIWVRDGDVKTVKKTRNVKSKQFTVKGEMRKKIGPRKFATVIGDVPIIETYNEGAVYSKIKLQEFNAASRKQIADRLWRKYEWKSPEVTKSGQDKIDEKVLSSVDFPEAEELCRYLAVDKKLSMLVSEKKKNGTGGGWLVHVREDGRVYGNVNPCGANTGRMTHSAPNVAQADSDPRMRELWEPRNGWVLVGTDAEGLELRELGHFLAPFDGGRFARAVVSGSKEDGTDAHTMNQRLAGLYSRASAKTLIYALIYGGGDAKLGEIMLEDAKAAGVKLKGAPTKIGKEVRKKLENGLGLGQLVKKVRFNSKKRNGRLKGLDGRLLRVRSLHSALNLLLQGAGACVMKKALVIFDEIAEDRFGLHGEKWAYCANVHDEVQVECIPEFAEPIGQLFADCITKAGEFYDHRCPLAGAYDIGSSWKETH